MPALTPANLSRLIGAGRIAVGVALLAVPDRAARPWLGEAGTTPAAQVALRGLGIRDALIGMAQIHTAGDPDRGYRWARTSAFADIVDLTATLAAARSLPRAGVAGTSVVAGSAAALCLVASRGMQAANGA
ncbi:hypothetical protein [Patulibacter defluvii]|uniref:hypothetical protein n=1 Tax=Patulibacter defluvii TaxID=3095358 RepID=UPI002A747EC9|nr:hypothetical protein [Patulibacter sp. DM4]